ncbi:extracellular solute-binding protein [Devosia psychrophila]|jgi:iron(III) transport system substrate-binding protein|uniref:Iron ABC transporter substrate-binding protein n=1 Tax=Devosia psychrophila TaxID=728005 RepID=A0A0F5PZG1_9HYPH|nr:extracellular solute-binding protein [Devosia psychrophila]KKC33209.1 iron ABC transporter substrate-binding protein [Devosia psychrophila]SFC27280.1 iron(III) transport system substrate-binding protein [Devosia psychrophila]
MITTKRLALTLLGSVALCGLAMPAFAQSGEVNIYSYREQSLLQPLLDGFSAETGIKANVLYAGDGLLERVAAEGELSPVDVVLTVDIGNLVGAEEQGLTQPITTPVLAERVPAEFRDDNANWTALSLRARVFYVSKDRVDATALTYDDIAGPEWKGRLCTRPGDHPYNIGLVAQRIAANGLDATRTWLTAVRDNLAYAPTGGDREGVKNILAGTCDLSITNTYYMGVMLNNDAEPEQKDWAASARIIYPDAEGAGTQVNVAGGFIAKHAPNAENANALIAFLLSDEAQAIYADTNYEFPVVASVAPAELTQSWGVLKAATTPLVEVAAHRAEAAALVDEIKFNEGAQK